MFYNRNKVKVLSAVFIAVLGALLTLLLYQAAVQSDAPVAVPLLAVLYVVSMYFLYKDAAKSDRGYASAQ